MKERDEFIDSIYELAGKLGEEAQRDHVDQDMMGRLLALGLQSCLGGIATIMEETSPRLGVAVGSRVGESEEDRKPTRISGTSE